MRDAIVAGKIGRPLAGRIVHAGTLPMQMLGWRLHTQGAGAGAIPNCCCEKSGSPDAMYCQVKW